MTVQFINHIKDCCRHEKILRLVFSTLFPVVESKRSSWRQGIRKPCDYYKSVRLRLKISFLGQCHDAN